MSAQADLDSAPGLSDFAWCKLGAGLVQNRISDPLVPPGAAKESRNASDSRTKRHHAARQRRPEGFKIRCPYGLEGSSPSFGTILTFSVSDPVPRRGYLHQPARLHATRAAVRVVHSLPAQRGDHRIRRIPRAERVPRSNRRPMTRNFLFSLSRSSLSESKPRPTHLFMSRCSSSVGSARTRRRFS